MGLHWSSFIQLQESAEQISFQFPTEHTRVGYFIDNIENNNPDLRVDIAIIRINMNGTRDDFETTIYFLLPVDPYLKQRNNFNKNSQIAGVDLMGKFQINTGVDFIWYEKDEYKNLTKEQHSKLDEWYKTKDRKYITNDQRQSSGQPPKVSAKKKLQVNISTLEAQLNAVEEGPIDKEIEAFLASATTGKPSAPENISVSPKYKSQVLEVHQILKSKR